MRTYLFLALLVIAGATPFFRRAVFMDEPIYLRTAQNIPKNWLFPQDMPNIFFGTPVANMAGHTHLPAGAYYLAFLYAVVGRFDEVRFRLLFAVFAVTAVLAFYFLAQRFTRHPLLVSALFALSPAFFVMMPALMMDIPMLAFLLLGIAFYFNHLERKHGLTAAGFCFVVSVVIGYTALVPLGCLAVFILFARRPGKELWAVAAGPLAILVWQLALAIHFHSVPIAQTLAYYRNQGSIGSNIAATMSFLGAVVLFPLVILVLDDGRSKRAVAAALIIGCVAGLTVSVPSPTARIWYIVLAASGVLMIAAFARSAAQIVKTQANAGEALFILWVPATLVFFIVVADMINARYILLSIPPLYLLLFRNSSVRQLAAVLAPTAILSFCIAYADSLYVNSYRDWAFNTVAPLQEQGFRIWNASESGLRFYVERKGIETLSSRDLRPRGADLIVTQNLFRYSLDDDLETMLTVIKRFTLTSLFPVRTFSRSAGAGFHDSRIGIVPFSFSLAPFDEVDILQVSPFVATLPQKGRPAEDIPAWSPDGVVLKQNVDAREFRVRIPANCKLEYEIIGHGTAEATPGGIILRRTAPGTIVWRRFRIVPAQFAGEVN